MKITIEAEPKEMAAFLLEIEKQPSKNLDADIEEIVKKLKTVSAVHIL